MPAREKEHLNLIFIGHVDHGKSTTVGRLLYETGAIPDNIIKRLKEEAEKLGKETFEFAFVMDRLKEERERGLTIDIAHREFETDKYYFTIIDAPGHRDFVKNMITGTSQADAAVLVVSAREGEGVQEQTREHVFLAKTLGVPQILVVINKMDATHPPYSQERFEKLKAEVEKLLKTVGYKPITVVPISAYYGENIVKPSEKMPWFKGPTLIQALNMIQPPKEKPVDKPLRIPVQDVYSIKGVGTVPVGRVETGRLRPGDKVVFMPPGVVGEVKSIEMHHKPLDEAVPGDNIGFNVRGVSKKDIKRGDVAGHLDNPPTVANTFTARIIILNHPTAIGVGYTPVIHAHTAQVACRFEELLQKLDPRTGQVIEEHPKFLKKGDVAVVKLRPIKPMVIEKYSEFPQLGRFAIRDMGMTIGAGQVIDIEPKKVEIKG